MTERISETLDDAPDVETKVGKFVLHVPKDANFLPKELPARLGSREYIEHNTSPLRQAHLDMLKGPGLGQAAIVGSIDFKTPQDCLRADDEPNIAIEKRLYKQLKELPEYALSYLSEGIVIDDPSQAGERPAPRMVARVTQSNSMLSRLEIKASVDEPQSPFFRLYDIHLVAREWVILQALIARLDQPSEDSNPEHIYLDFDSLPRVSEIEFALMEVIASYDSAGRVPKWGDDVRSHHLVEQERYLFDQGRRLDTAHELVSSMRELEEVTGYTQQINQGDIIAAIHKALKNQK